MEWFSRKTSIAGVQVPNWMVVLSATTHNKLDPIETNAWRPQRWATGVGEMCRRPTDLLAHLIASLRRRNSR